MAAITLSEHMLRKPECVLLVLDCGKSLDVAVYDSLRDVAKRMARTRVLYGQQSTDRMGLIAVGAALTRNPLADENPGGYSNIDIVLPVSRLSVDILHAIQELPLAKKGVNILDALEVAGDHLATRTSSERLQRRIVLFTDAEGSMGSSYDESVDDLTTFASLCNEENIQFDVVFADGLPAEKPYGDDSWEDPELCASGNDADLTHHCDRFFSQQFLQQSVQRRRTRYESVTQRREGSHSDGDAIACGSSSDKCELPNERVLGQQALLTSLALALGGCAWSLADASTSVDMPHHRDKRAFAKFRGVFDIAGVVQIPVKVFNLVLEAKRPSATALSWEMSKRRHGNAFVINRTRYVAVGELESGHDVEPEDVMDAYPYGPNLVSEKNEILGYSWEIACPKQFKLICCVKRDSVPVYQFMGNVSVVLPMSGVPSSGPQLAMRALVTALSDEGLGIAARFVTRDQGKPTLVFLWPAIEDGRQEDAPQLSAKGCNDTGSDSEHDEANAYDSRYLYMVELPTGHDVKHFPFSSLKNKVDKLSTKSRSAMDAFVNAMDLDRCVSSVDDGSHGARSSSKEELAGCAGTLTHAHVENDFDDIEYFDPALCCNPTIDRFNVAVIERCLAGAEAQDLPDVPAWATELMDASKHIPRSNTATARRCLEDLRNLFPVSEFDIREKRAKRHARMAPDELESIAHFMPPAEGNDDFGHGSREEANEDVSSAKGQSVDSSEENAVSVVDDGASMMTDCPLMVSDQTPVPDFRALIRHGHYNEAFDTMSTLIYRKIRDGDVDVAEECTAAFRESSRKLKKVNEFHSLLEHILAKSCPTNRGSHAFVTFLRHVHVTERWADTLAPLQAHSPEQSKRMLPSAEEVKEVAEELKRIATHPHPPSHEKAEGASSYLTSTIS